MDMSNGNGDGDVKESLLAEGKTQLGGAGWRSRLCSVNSLRNEFISRLPDKVRGCVDLESSSPVDLSKASGLTQGLFLLSFWEFEICIFVLHCFFQSS